MGKRANVQLYGRQNRGIRIDPDATDGAVIGTNLWWSDGTLVSEADLRRILNDYDSTITQLQQYVTYILGEGGGGALTDWPLHKDFIGPAETLTITTDFQYLIWESFDVQGSLIIEPGGSLVIFGDGVPDVLGPAFTYNVNDELTQIDYDDGSQKLFTYNSGDLTRVDFIQDGVTFRKDFNYSGGELTSVDEYYV